MFLLKRNELNEAVGSSTTDGGKRNGRIDAGCTM